MNEQKHIKRIVEKILKRPWQLKNLPAQSLQLNTAETLLEEIAYAHARIDELEK
jgi:hypothetical protein